MDVVLDTSDIMAGIPDMGARCQKGSTPGIEAGAQVVLLDAAGAVIGMGELAAGTLVNETASPPNRACRLTFDIDVPDVANLDGDFFSLRFGSDDTTYPQTAEDIAEGPRMQIGDYYWH